ncbi:CpaD family pilus assembly lipoprotein [Trinickia acidisoli]|uniref:CpaD family pilus assembly lipoprotein n=1 Tax=Trinickia acidisoli TaxID=2767482 RepID=UPI001A909C94|nr:CpaD family pilus assembly lipoprotein [Trinickia acidisoli]
MRSPSSLITHGIAAIPLALLSACMSTPPSLSLPDASVIRVEDGKAVAPDCAQLATTRDFLDAGEARATVSLGCATYTNLAAMLVRPADLTAPVPFGGSDPDLAASAVRRYETDKLAPLPEANTSNVNR